MADLKISQLTGATTPLAGTEVVPLVQSSTTKKVAVSDLTAGRSVSAASVAVSTGDLSFGSTGQKITADFSNSNQALRTAFQTTTTNGATRLTVIPNGTGSITAVNLADRTDIANASVLNVNMVGGSEAQINSNRNGTGTFLPLTVLTNGSAQFTFNTSGNLAVRNAAKGVDFTANTPAAGMTSQLLNWYETGTFTPTFVPNAGAGFTSVTYNSVTGGRYTRIGNVVHIQCVVRTDAITVGSATGALCIGGLPFTAVANTTGRNGYSTFSTGQVVSWAGTRPLSGSVSASDTKIILWGRSSVSGDTAATDVTDLGTGASANYIELSGSYICA